MARNGRSKQSGGDGGTVDCRRHRRGVFGGVHLGAQHSTRHADRDTGAGDFRPAFRAAESRSVGRLMKRKRTVTPEGIRVRRLAARVKRIEAKLAVVEARCRCGYCERARTPEPEKT